MDPQLHTFPSEIRDVLCKVPLQYASAFYHLFILLHRHPHSSQFISRLNSLHDSAGTFLPLALTTPNLEDLAVSFRFCMMILKLSDMINTLLDTVLTTVTIFVPSQGLSNTCSDVLTALNTGLYADQSVNIFTLCDSMFTSLGRLLNGLFPALQYSALTNFPSELLSMVNNTASSDRPDLSSEVDSFLHGLINTMISNVRSFLVDMGHEARLRYVNSFCVDCHLEASSVPYVYQARENAGSDSDNCSVCLEDLKDGDYARRLRCLHHFHLQCIDRSLRTNRNCPLCRTPVDANQD